MPSWWSASRVEATVTRDFVLSRLGPAAAPRLDEPVSARAVAVSGETYCDAICLRARRFFLVLVDVGVADQIFSLVDGGWDDSDLPVAVPQVRRLRLINERVERRFHQRQFAYLLKTMDRGQRHDYDQGEVVPVEVVSGAVSFLHRGHYVDKVKLPNAPGCVFSRLRYHLGQGSHAISPAEFSDLVSGIQVLQHDHLVSYWASYTHLGSGYILLWPCSDGSLKSFLSSTPSPFKNLPKLDRRRLVVNWILCLADTLCFLHSRGARSHGAIKPSSVCFTRQNHIALADPNRLIPEGWASHLGQLAFDRERYDYAAPEQWDPLAAYYHVAGGDAVLPSSFPSPWDHVNLKSLRGAKMPNKRPHWPRQQAALQRADIFSLGCIILELLSFLVKRSTSKFASFRSARHKTAGRGGAVLDTSFHRNLGQVEAWMSEVAKDASKKVADAEGGAVFRGVVPMLHVVTSMLATNPHERPTAYQVQQKIYQIITEDCGIQEPHCVHDYAESLHCEFGRTDDLQDRSVGRPAGALYHREQTVSSYERALPPRHPGGLDSGDEYSQASASTGDCAEQDHDASGSYSMTGVVPLSREADRSEDS